MRNLDNSISLFIVVWVIVPYLVTLFELHCVLLYLNYIVFFFCSFQTYGVTPSNSQIKEAGDACPICQDDYKSPSMLQCKVNKIGFVWIIV